VRQTTQYETIKAYSDKYPVQLCCKALNVSRAAYYRWLSGKKSRRTVENERIAEQVERIHMKHPDKGYRRIADDLRHDQHLTINDKRIRRICRKKSIKSTIKYSSDGCTRHAKEAQFLAENVLNRNFHAENPNEKWLTDVTEFKWYEGMTVHKVYLSAILDLADRRIVSYVLSDRNDNALVFQTLKEALRENPDAHPIFHSDRGFQYTSRGFHQMLEAAHMTQSMSRVAHCIDNGPMEGFWGILKREKYYGHKFTSREKLVKMIESYVLYYNSQRVQRNLGVCTPMEKHAILLAA